MGKRKMVKHDGYSSVVCEHHQDILTCSTCQIFKDGVKIVSRVSWWQILRNPIAYIKYRWFMRQMAKELIALQRRDH